jgi:2-polyprenyl-3-methyl-5-hydroxy-6-metoxy-1,4-benzoquinol methylase
VTNRFSEEDLTAFYEGMDESFFNIADVSSQSIRLQRISEIEKLTQGSRGTTKRKILDVGAGSGLFLYIAQEHGFDVFGTEFSPELCERARVKYGIKLDPGPLEQNRNDGFYDVLTLWDVIEHLQDPKAVVQECYRLLGPNGIVGIDTPCVDGLYDKIAMLVYKLSRGKISTLLDRRLSKAHLQIFSEELLNNLLRETGFAILESRRICEYSLPVERYLQQMRIENQALRSLMAMPLRFLIRHNLFFRNKVLVYATRPS